MSEHDADAVVERIANSFDADEWGADYVPDTIRDVLAALKSGDRLPGGNKVAPERPTGVMLAAAYAAAPDVRSDDVWAIYEAMLAATTTNPRGPHADDH